MLSLYYIDVGRMVSDIEEIKKQHDIVLYLVRMEYVYCDDQK